MKNIWKWILLGAIFFLLAFCVALPLLGGLGGMPRGFLGGGLIHRMPMMGGFGLAGVLGLAIRCILPILIVAGLIVLVVMLVRKPSSGAPLVTPPTKPCPACGKPVQEDWVACPACGEKLK
jgi:hypothetical protein